MVTSERVAGRDRRAANRDGRTTGDERLAVNNVLRY